jgi:hypothetical protein
MKKINILILAIIISLFGCMKSQIEDSLITSSHLYQATTITILPKNPDDKHFAECLQKELKKDLPNLKVIPEYRFRDALFPWFEYRTAPKDAKELSATLNKPSIRSHLESIGVEILVYVHGETSQSNLEGPGFCGGGYGAAGCLGYVEAGRETHIATTIWNLKERISLGNTDIHFQGKVRVPMLIIPIPIPAFTEGSACSETAMRISDRLKNNNPLEDK